MSEERASEERVTKSDVLDVLKFYKDAVDERYLTAADISAFTTDTATTSANGLMSSADKIKLNAVTTDTATASSTGLISASDKVRLDYLYNNAVIGYQSDTYNISLMSAADNLVVVIPIAEEPEPLDEEYFNQTFSSLTASHHDLGVYCGNSDTVTIKTDIARDRLPYHTLTWELSNAPDWCSLDSENSFYTDNGTEYVQRILTAAPPLDTSMDSYDAVVRLTMSYKVNDGSSVSDATKSNSVTISVVIYGSSPPMPDDPE